MNMQAVSLALQRTEGEKLSHAEQSLYPQLNSLDLEESRTALLDIKKAIFVVLESEDRTV